MTSNSSPTNSYPIKTVVVLVQENRSFDHMLGWMRSLNPKINGVTGSESNPISTADPNSNRVQFSDRSIYVDPDPGHSIQDIYEQIFGEPWSEASAAKELPPMMEGFAQNATRQEKPKETTTLTMMEAVMNGFKPDLVPVYKEEELPPMMEGFAQNATRQEKPKETTTLTMMEAVMNGFKPDLVPVYKELVKEFAICDRWFASVPASTQPNRLYVHSATSHGLTSNDPSKLIGGLPQKTIFDSLDENGFNFGIYYQQPPSTLFYRNLRQLKYIDNFHEYGLTFKKHCEEGKLPNYVVIEQRFFDLFSIPANDDHPSHDVGEGQKFVKEVYEALRGSPQWNEMLFVITYDEHGGFYDHVPTPVDGVPSPDDIVAPEPFKFKFDRLGVRVPTIFISPWIEPGKVLHEPSGPFPTSQYEHSSIPATVKKIFNLPNFLTKRDAWAGTFESLLTLTSPRTDCPEKLPDPIKLRETAAKERAKLSEFQEELVQMAATLNGDHRKSIYPDKLVESMCVSDAVKYVEDAFTTFLNECEKAKKNGADGSEIVDCANSCSTQSNSKNFFHKMLSCVTCDR